MKGTLKIAQQFEDAIGNLWDGDKPNELHGRCLSVYSCDAVGDMLRASAYIDCVAPTVSGQTAAFGKYSDSDYIRGWTGGGVKQVSRSIRMKIQMQRALWLTMLAELAEQGEEFPNEDIDWKYRRY